MVYTLSPLYRPRPEDFVSGAPALLSGGARGFEKLGAMHYKARQNELDRESELRRSSLGALLKAGHSGAQREAERMAGLEHEELGGTSGLTAEQGRMFDRYATMADAAQDPETQSYYVRKMQGVLGEVPLTQGPDIPEARQSPRVLDMEDHLQNEWDQYTSQPSVRDMLASYRRAERTPAGAVSSAQARSIYQITPGTFQSLQDMYPDLPKISHEALSDPKNQGIAENYAAALDRANRDELQNRGESVTPDNLLSMYYTGDPLDEISPARDEKYGVTEYVKRGRGGQMETGESRVAGRLKPGGGPRFGRFKKQAQDPYESSYARKQAERDFQVDQGLSKMDKQRFDMNAGQMAEAQKNSKSKEYTRRFTQLSKSRDRDWQEYTSTLQMFYKPDPNTGKTLQYLMGGDVTPEEIEAYKKGQMPAKAVKNFEPRYRVYQERTRLENRLDSLQRSLTAKDEALDALGQMWNEGYSIDEIDDELDSFLKRTR